IPSRAASFGPWMCTGEPSNRTSPSSAGWIPAMHLMSVDLPAPLSPTRAMTSPAATRKSTWYSAWTAPNRFEIPRSSRTGWLSVMRSQPCLVAQRRDRAGADVLALQRGVLDRLIDVLPGDGDRLQQDRRHLLTRVVRLVVDEAGRRLLALGERSGQLRSRIGLLVDVLVDRHALVAREDVLQALRRRVLAGDRDLRQLALLERGDHRVAEAVVGRQHAVDLVVRLLKHLLEDGQRLLVVPLRHGLVGDLLGLAAVVQRVEHGVVALLEQRGVVVRRRPVELGDAGIGLALEALHEALALQLAHGHVVERDVVVARALERQAVVVDDLDAARLRVRLDGGAGAGVEVRQQQHLRAVGDGLLGLLLLRGLVALRVLDLDGHAEIVEGLLQERSVGLLPAVRGLRVRQQDRDLLRLATTAAATAARRRVVVVTAAAGEHGHSHCKGAERQCRPSHSLSPLLFEAV